ncbi:MAG: histidine kinase [Bacteroidia bacterium]
MKPFQKPSAAIYFDKIGLLLLVVLMYLSCNKPTEKAPSTLLTAQGDSILWQATTYMDKGKFEAAQTTLLTALNKQNSAFSKRDKYYFHSHLAEIMYYTALNEQGLQNAREAIQLANTDKNDTLLGNAYNLLGLIHLNSERYDSALHYFNRALVKIPFHLNDPKLSRYDQVLGNLSEAYLKTGDALQAIQSARKAQEISTKNGMHRAIILNNWTIAEAYLLLHQYDSTAHYLDLGLRDAHLAQFPDAQLFLISNQLKLFAEQKNTEEIYTNIELGIVLCEKLEDFDFAVSEYLSDAVRILLEIGDFKKASAIQNKLNTIERKINKEKETLHMQLLNSFYNKTQELDREKSDAVVRQKELEYNRLILISLAIVILLLVLFIVFYRRWTVQRRKTDRLRFDQEQERIRQEQELVKMNDRYSAIEAERNRIARELHDDIGSSLSSISIFAEMALNDFGNNPENSRTLLQRVKDKNQEVSDTVSDLIWAIYTKNDTMGSLMLRVKNVGYEVLSAKGIEMKIADDFRLKDAALTIEQKKNLLLYFKEALNNIPKYSGAKLVRIESEWKNDQVHISVKDDGIGFDQDLVKKGNGLAGFQARANAIGGKFFLKTKPGEGTQLLLDFPFQITLASTLDERQ